MALVFAIFNLIAARPSRVRPYSNPSNSRLNHRRMARSVALSRFGSSAAKSTTKLIGSLMNVLGIGAESRLISLWCFAGGLARAAAGAFVYLHPLRRNARSDTASHHQVRQCNDAISSNLLREQ